MNTYNLFNLHFIDFQKNEDILRLFTENNNNFLHLITPNIQIIDLLNRNKSLYQYFSSNCIAIPDGFPIVISIKLLLNKKTKRYTGADLLIELLPLIKNQNKLIICSNQLVASKLKIPHTINLIAPEKTSFESEVENFSDQITQEIIKNKIKYVFIGIGNPSQMILGKLIDEKIRSEVYSCYVFQLGNSFEFLTGLDKRAPKWMRKFNLEWFHRFVLHPKKMFKRYFIDSSRFIKYFFKEYKKSR
jgi:N-acetylglucosaminyldiphosphoundecaprenol N-acetyl-beta-D-mannosaminyltransferase